MDIFLLGLDDPVRSEQVCSERIEQEQKLFC